MFGFYFAAQHAYQNIKFSGLYHKKKQAKKPPSTQDYNKDFKPLPVKDIDIFQNLFFSIKNISIKLLMLLSISELLLVLFFYFFPCMSLGY